MDDKYFVLFGIGEAGYSLRTFLSIVFEIYALFGSHIW